MYWNISRPPNPQNMNTFYNEITESLSKAAMKLAMITMGDFNIGIKSKGYGYGKFDSFCNFFNLTNLIYSGTCLMRNWFFWLINPNHFKGSYNWNKSEWLPQTDLYIF